MLSSNFAVSTIAWPTHVRLSSIPDPKPGILALSRHVSEVGSLLHSAADFSDDIRFSSTFRAVEVALPETFFSLASSCLLSLGRGVSRTKIIDELSNSLSVCVLVVSFCGVSSISTCREGGRAGSVKVRFNVSWHVEFLRGRNNI